ncbi:CAAX protease self-immunity [Rubrobacter radiotolerans]|uniref:CAAX protease self-immunity n=1 Tax=Rubrobacter radiotolerans TaxID=42256 RepID=A0A023X0T0_RUBRA|nr:CPBP family intramembrane glutamic endopeptidase [Rubrobacter radiotolerans]AHY45669.1 CAAX protease self-immunity [Rubrobacter radiotolerans]MDX5893083.1 CPBP family intramembrane glutamic endopeptidase [Rubrobacter radiotolerans]
MILGGFLSAVTTVFLRGLGYSAESTVQQPFMDSLQGWVAANPAVAVPAIVAVVVFLGPAAEEIAFRGGIFRLLKHLGEWLSGTLGGGKVKVEPGNGGREKAPSRLPVVLAAVLSSVFFALLHLEPVILPTLLVFALVLCYILERTKSLLPCIVAHATFNSFATSVIVLGGLGVLDPLPV